MPKDLTNLFCPKSIAVVGASRTPQKVGSVILKNIVDSGFKGKVFPINPKAQVIGELKCFPDISSLPETPEMAVVAVPSETVIETLSQLGEKGTKNVVVITAGFKEIGEDGKKLENQLIETAKKYNMNVLGPNCLGFVNNNCPLNATFGQPVNKNGNIRFLSQSGAIAAGIFDWIETSNLGFSDFITLGNKAVLTEVEILEYFNNQPRDLLNEADSEGISNVKPIGMYLESITNGTRFLEIASEITKKDPIFVLKPGKSEAAAKAMQSHTGAIAGEDYVLDTVLNQAGVLRCESLEDFFDLSKAFSWEDVPQGPKVAIISNAGGPAVISADAVIKEGLEFVKFSEETNKELKEILPRSASIINPVDVLGDALAMRFSQASEIILQKENVDALIFIVTPQLMTQVKETAEAIGYLSKKYKKPIFCSFMGGNLITEGEKILNEYRIPSFRYPERAIKAIGSMWKWKNIKDEPKIKDETHEVTINQDENAVRPILQEAINKKYKTLDNISADIILSTAGIKTPPTKIAESIEDAISFAKEHGWPIVLKLSSPDLLHKDAVGGVMVDIMNEEALQDAWYQLRKQLETLDPTLKERVKVQVQKQVLNGIEVIVGVKHDPTFGTVILFGAGGKYAELIGDRNLHLIPIDYNLAKELVRKSKIFSILNKKNGDGPKYALDKLYELILRVAMLPNMIPEAEDIEINPVIVTYDEVWAVDGKVILREVEQKAAPKAPRLISAKCTKHEILASKFHFYELETEEPFNFASGQYISVKVAPTAIRAYSIATKISPTQFALLVDTRPGGPGSMFFENLKVDETVPFLGPFGAFTYKIDDSAEQLLFLGTGSGMSAIRCMIDGALKEQNEKRPMTLYFGLTFEEEIFWKNHFEQLKQEHPNFNYEIVLCKPGENWKGLTGFITQPLKENFPDASKCAAYLCGHRAMIADATQILLENGCPNEKIYQERFV